METGILGVSVHHALGGRPLWLAVLSIRNSTEAQAAATIAGHRLHRLLGGFAVHFPLEPELSAVALRLNEVAVVATYFSHAGVDADTFGAQSVAESCRAALVELCGGHLADVTLLTLNKFGGLVQLALRKAALGFGRLQHAGTPKFDVSVAQVSPDAAPDDATSIAIRASNDITAGHLQPAMDAYASGYTKLDTMVDSVRNLRYHRSMPARPGPAAQQVALSVLPKNITLEAVSRVPKIPSGGLFYGDPTGMSESKLGKDVIASTTPAPQVDASEEQHRSSSTKFTRPAHELSRPWAPAEDEDESDEDVNVVLDRTVMSDRDEEEEEVSGRVAQPEEIVPQSLPATGTTSNAFDVLFSSKPPLPEQTQPRPQSVSSDVFDVFGPLAGSHTSTPAYASPSVAPCAPAVNSSPRAFAPQPVELVKDVFATSVATPSALPTAGPQVDAATATANVAWQSGATAVHASSDVPHPPNTQGFPATASPTSAPQIQVEVKLAAQLSESISVVGKPGGAEQTTIEGTIALKYLLGALLPPPLAATGFGGLKLPLQLVLPADVAECTFVSTDGCATTLGMERDPISGVANFVIPLPQRASQISDNHPIDIGTLRYRYVSAYQPPIVKLLASAKPNVVGVAAEGGAGGMRQQGTDVILKTMLHPSVSMPVHNAQFLVQLPPPVTPLGSTPGTYDAGIVSKPAAQFNAQKGQILWNLIADDAPLPAGLVEDLAPRSKLYLTPGKAAELKARVRVVNGAIIEAAAAAAAGAAVHCPLQFRFNLPSATLFAPTIRACDTSPSAEAAALDSVSNHRLRVRVVGTIVQRGAGAYKAVWKY